MAKTQLTDIIIPAQFASYVLQRTAEKSDLFQSGIVENNPDYNDRAAQGGTQVNMPHWNDLTGNRQPLSDSSPLTTVKVVADQDIARIHNDEDELRSGLVRRNSINNIAGYFFVE